MQKQERHESGWFTYAKRSTDARGIIHFEDCTLLQDLVLDRDNNAKTQELFVCGHTDHLCKRGAHMDLIQETPGHQLLGWQGDSYVMDLYYK